ncbi:MAG: ThiF family adenylyltransferase, partial [Steroidobacteraceae bacterium]|nr:ThiF family adenylyltransferase [Steroidobacteraceae bacterium]
VEEGNLHRQPLYRMMDLGQRKAEVARRRLADLNPAVSIESACYRLTPENAATFVAASDVVVDCADSFAVTYTLSDECMRAGKPLVSASVIALAGYVGVFCGLAPSYRAVFPEMPSHAASCASAGVLGTAVAVVGSLQAQMVLALVLGLQPPVWGKLVSVDFAKWRFGGFSFLSAKEPPEPEFTFIALSQVRADDLICDLRSADEGPALADSLRVSVEQIVSATAGAAPGQRIVLCCRSGVRAWRAARKLQARGYTNLALVALGN